MKIGNSSRRSVFRDQEKSVITDECLTADPCPLSTVTDILHLDGHKEKIDLGSLTLKEALVSADRNINENWSRYKQRFIEEYGK